MVGAVGELMDVKTRWFQEKQLPLVVEPKKACSFGGFLEMLREGKPWIEEKLHRSGGVLFRGFPVTNAVEFDAVIDAVGLGKGIPYVGGDSPRVRVHGHVYTSTEAPPYFKIPLHNELSFIDNFPKHIYFFCETPSNEGGATILGDAREIVQSVDPAVRERLEARLLKYISRYYFRSPFMEMLNKVQKGHKTWIDVFETQNKEEVERKCRDNNFSFRWNKNDWLEISQMRPAVIDHPHTKERAWFNQLHLYDFNPRLLGWGNYIGAKLVYCQRYKKLHEVFYGDGGAIDRSDIYHIMEVLDRKTISFPWQKGDVLVLDNILAMHGRAPFAGKRRVLAAMTS